LLPRRIQAARAIHRKIVQQACAALLPDISDVSPGAFPLIRTSLGFTATASISSPLATETRWMFIGCR
jgi:hypothetical protein